MEKPLAAARARLEAAVRAAKRKRKDQIKRASRVEVDKEAQIINMRAAGVAPSRIAKAARMDVKTVHAVLVKPENQLEVIKRRELLKQLSIHRMHEVAGVAWDMAHEAAEGRDAKAFDAAMRGLHAGEKIAASVSGENQRVQVEHSGQVQVDHREELRALIGIIIGHQPE